MISLSRPYRNKKNKAHTPIRMRSDRPRCEGAISVRSSHTCDPPNQKDENGLWEIERRYRGQIGRLTPPLLLSLLSAHHSFTVLFFLFYPSLFSVTKRKTNYQPIFYQQVATSSGTCYQPNCSICSPCCLQQSTPILNACFAFVNKNNKYI